MRANYRLTIAGWLVGWFVLAGLPVSWQPRLWKITMATGREGTVTGTSSIEKDADIFDYLNLKPICAVPSVKGKLC